MPSGHVGSAGQELEAGPFRWFPRLGSSPHPPWNTHRVGDSMVHSHASGVRLSRALGHTVTRDATAARHL